MNVSLSYSGYQSARRDYLCNSRLAIIKKYEGHEGKYLPTVVDEVLDANYLTAWRRATTSSDDPQPLMGKRKSAT